MKPSERIRAAANAQLAAHYHLERLGQLDRTAVSAAVMVAELLTYLDEHAELDRRRRAAARAIAFAASGDWALARRHLLAAGLPWLDPTFGQSITGLLELIEQEGLL